MKPDDYLEAVARLTERDKVPAKTSDIAAHLRISPSSATEMLQKLAREGMVSYRPYRGVTLTDRGRRAAERVARRQGVLERFLADTLRFPPAAAREEARSMEASDAVVERLCGLLGHPRSRPDGTPIPAGACCGKA